MTMRMGEKQQWTRKVKIGRNVTSRWKKHVRGQGKMNLKSKQRERTKCKLIHLSNCGKAQTLETSVNQKEECHGLNVCVSPTPPLQIHLLKF